MPRLKQHAISQRELQVGSLLAQGLGNKQIAYDLGIAERTVKIHRFRCMQKLRAASLADLVRTMDKLSERRNFVFELGAGI